MFVLGFIFGYLLAMGVMAALFEDDKEGDR